MPLFILRIQALFTLFLSFFLFFSCFCTFGIFVHFVHYFVSNPSASGRESPWVSPLKEARSGRLSAGDSRTPAPSVNNFGGYSLHCIELKIRSLYVVFVAVTKTKCAGTGTGTFKSVLCLAGRSLRQDRSIKPENSGPHLSFSFLFFSLCARPRHHLFNSSSAVFGQPEAQSSTMKAPF